MTSAITSLQKRRIKEMVDEIIVNRGILKISDRQTQVDGVDIEKLSSLAFKYYKMIILGESPLDIDKQTGAADKYQPDSRDQSNRRNCIGCSKLLEESDIKDRMPVCKSCREKIKVEYDVLRELLR